MDEPTTHATATSTRDVRLERLAPLLLWLVIGTVFCALFQIVFRFGLIGRGLGLYLFIWAYAQAALLSHIVLAADGSFLTVLAALWLTIYLGMAAILWFVFSSWRWMARYGPWPIAILGWGLLQAVLFGAYVCAAYLGIV